MLSPSASLELHTELLRLAPVDRRQPQANLDYFVTACFATAGQFFLPMAIMLALSASNICLASLVEKR